MKVNISPEDKLLRLIRAGKKSESKEGPKTRIKSSYANLLGEKQFSLLVRKIILASFFLALSYLIFSFIYPLFGYKKIEAVQRRGLEERQVREASELKIEPLEFYLQGTQGRQIFTSPAVSEEGPKVLQEEVKNPVNDLKLLGILSGNNPQAIIEDTKNQKTYYLNKGQSVGEIKLEDIQDGKIILDYRGEQFELYL